MHNSDIYIVYRTQTAWVQSNVSLTYFTSFSFAEIIIIYTVQWFLIPSSFIVLVSEHDEGEGCLPPLHSILPPCPQSGCVMASLRRSSEWCLIGSKCEFLLQLVICCDLCIIARDLRSRMSRIQLAIVKSFRVSLCEQPPKKNYWLGHQKGLEKCVWSSQLVQAG